MLQLLCYQSGLLQNVFFLHVRCISDVKGWLSECEARLDVALAKSRPTVQGALKRSDPTTAGGG